VAGLLIATAVRAEPPSLASTPAPAQPAAVPAPSPAAEPLGLPTVPAPEVPPVTAAPAAASPSPAPRPEPRSIPTADATPAESDHDAVVGKWGIEARRFDPGPLPLALRSGLGCSPTEGVSCTVALGAVGVRYWWRRNLAWNAYLVVGSGGGSVGPQGLDTYLGIGPVLGLNVLLGNWRHLAISASPELAVVLFRPAGSGGSTVVYDMRGALEGELHFGFIGVPALSIGIVAGMGVVYEATPEARLWSLGVLGAGSVRDVLTDLFVRYYL
jgi:hypothetical protein